MVEKVDERTWEAFIFHFGQKLHLKDKNMIRVVLTSYLFLTLSHNYINPIWKLYSQYLLDNDNIGHRCILKQKQIYI